MAAIQTAVVQAALNTTTGTQDFTADLGGNTPKAAILILTYGTTNGTVVDHFGYSISFTDGTNELSAEMTHEHGVGTTDVDKRLSSTKIAQIMLPGEATRAIDCEADFSQWLSTTDTGDSTSGIRINITNAPASALLLTVILFAGSDLQAHAGVEALGNVGVATDVTAPGFRPQIVFAACTEGVVGASANGRFSFGVAVDSGGITQRCIALMDNNGNATSFPSGFLSTVGACAETTSGGVAWTGSVSNFDANGFSVTPLTGNAGSDMIYLALDVGDTGVWCGTVDAPTLTGSDWTETGPGFTPQLGILGLSMHTAVDSHDGTGKSAVVGMAAFTSTQEYCNTACVEDGQGTMDNQCLVDNQMLNLPDDGGVQAFDISSPTLNASGWTVASANIVAANATTRKWWGFALGEASAAAALAPAHIAAL